MFFILLSINYFKTWNDVKVYSLGFNWQNANTGSETALVTNGRQTIWTNDYVVLWRICASRGLNELTFCRLVMCNSRESNIKNNVASLSVGGFGTNCWKDWIFIPVIPFEGGDVFHHTLYRYIENQPSALLCFIRYDCVISYYCVLSKALTIIVRAASYAEAHSCDCSCVYEVIPNISLIDLS